MFFFIFPRFARNSTPTQITSQGQEIRPSSRKRSDKISTTKVITKQRFWSRKHPTRKRQANVPAESDMTCRKQSCMLRFQAGLQHPSLRQPLRPCATVTKH